MWLAVRFSFYFIYVLVYFCSSFTDSLLLRCGSGRILPSSFNWTDFHFKFDVFCFKLYRVCLLYITVCMFAFSRHIRNRRKDRLVDEWRALNRYAVEADTMKSFKMEVKRVYGRKGKSLSSPVSGFVKCSLSGLWSLLMSPCERKKYISLSVKPSHYFFLSFVSNFCSQCVRGKEAP